MRITFKIFKTRNTSTQVDHYIVVYKDDDDKEKYHIINPTNSAGNWYAGLFSGNSLRHNWRITDDTGIDPDKFLEFIQAYYSEYYAAFINELTTSEYTSELRKVFKEQLHNATKSRNPVF